MVTRNKKDLQKNSQPGDEKARFNPKVSNIKPGSAEFERPEQKAYNIPADSVQDRLDKVKNLSVNYKRFFPTERVAELKSVRFMNPNDEKILQATRSLKNNTELPKWCKFIEQSLSIKKNRLYLNELPFVLRDEKHQKIKRIYFNPSQPISIQGVYDFLDNKYANITRKNVKESLQRLEVYQRTFRRRKPPTITSRISFKSPGLLCADCFFPSKYNGWLGKRTVFCVADYWSRYVGIYTLQSKDSRLVKRAFEKFVRSFIKASGKFPKKLLIDKGTELVLLKDVMEKFRTKRDGKNPMVLHSQTGAPVNFIEQVNSDAQKRMQIYNRLTRKVEELTTQITYAINRQGRIRKGKLSPIQLLQLNAREINKINREYKSEPILGLDNLPPIEVGDTVRILLMTRKEQVSSMNPEHKGFAIKWSGKIFRVIKKVKLRKNANFYNYYMHGEKNPRYRHEILKINPNVDTTWPQIKNALGNYLMKL